MHAVLRILKGKIEGYCRLPIEKIPVITGADR